MTISRRHFAFGALAAAATPALAARKRKQATATKMLDAIIIGAGISGINAALLLEAEGKRVMILEGRQRAGGRVHTLLDQPGTPEMGFNSMAAGYGRGIDAAKRANVELWDIGARYIKAPPQGLYLGGKHVSREEWKANPANPFPAAMKAMMPWEVSPRMVAQHNPLKDWTQWHAPENAAHDISLQAFLRQHGLSDGAIRFAYDSSPYYGSSAWEVSALMLEYNDGFVKAQMASGRESLAVRGGNSRLIAGLTRQLKGDLLLGKKVTGISSAGDAATVSCADGSAFRAGRVICALPLATMRHIAFEPGIEGPRAQAIATIPYHPLVNVFLTTSRPYWQEDGLSPAMWTDGPLGTILPQYFGAKDDEVTGLLVQGRGELAYAWDRMGPERAMATIVETLEKLRPASRGAVKAVHYHSWLREEFSTGAFAYFQPGQIKSLQASLAEPAGRVHFCGEHTATTARGLEGALESSERVALEVLTA